jgi:hypothetical protein
MLRIGGNSPGVAATWANPEARNLGDALGFARQLNGSQAGSRPVPAAVASVGATIGLLALQEVRQAQPSRRRAVARAAAILDDLGELRTALLEGSGPTEIVERLRARLAAEVERGGDEELEQILDAVDLRAHVELAKLDLP